MTRVLALLLILFALPATASAQGVVSGELKQWHRVTVTFTGPETSETAQPNPFLDYRLEVAFSQGDRQIVVPGYYAADGNAGNSGAVAGNRWRVHFTPDRPGKWTYRASFRHGKNVAVAVGPGEGKPTAFDGATGSFSVVATDKKGRDHRAKGTLRYTGGHYLRFAGTGEFFLKGGADSPENFLGYADFDNTRHAGQKKPREGEALPKGLHRYAPHVRDWQPTDPTWRDGKGKGIIGALNYLSSEGMNSVYFLTMNVGGDGKDVWPWIDPDGPLRFDCSKLDQWEIVFSHMDRMGLLLHVITQETENDQLLDGGDLGLTRRLYYRELVARFGHHPALVWNLGEENTNTDTQRSDFCRYIDRLDAYGHPIVLHTYPGKYDEAYTPLLEHPQFYGPSLQIGDMKKTHAETLKWVTRSARSGRKWIVCLDEIGPANTGVKPDADDPGHDDVRQYALWGNLMAGGSGAEWYFGYKFAHNDLNCEDWRSREKMWAQTRHALEFFQKYLPFNEMQPSDGLTPREDDYCLAKPGEVYAVYLPQRGTTSLRLPAGQFTVMWYNPRSGGPLQPGSVADVPGGDVRPLGDPPTDKSQDWVVLVRKASR